ncbi:MAG TPA: phage tail tube protein [Acidobacteriaceae bacterium]|jgi:hypothetical protein|nr:phage tail tube protein [Acidobacteriaceae bacterium]
MPTAFTTQRSLLRNVVLPANIQATLAETMADAAFTYRGRPDTSGFFQIELGKESDYQYAGKGSSFATESRLITQQSSGEIDARLDDFLAGWMLAMCMGTEVYTAGADGAANTHVLTWADTGAPAQLTNVYIEDAPGLKRKFIDMSCTKVVLSGADKGSIMAKASFIGTGRYTDGVIAAGLPALPTAQYIYGSDSIVSIGPAGAPVSMAPRVLSWEATFDHANDLFRSCGGGVYPVFPRYGNPVHSLKLVIAIDTTSDVRDWMMNQTLLEVKIAATSSATSLTIDYPNVIIPKSDLGEQDKYVIYTVELDQQSILKPAGAQPVTATVMNTEVAYLTAA